MLSYIAYIQGKMKSLSTWLLVMFMVMFWGFRIVVAFQAQYGHDFGGFIAFDFNTEIILLFLTIISFILVIRRNLIGGLIYIISYGYYFGGYIVTNLLPGLLSGEVVQFSILQNGLVSSVGLLLAFCVLFDLVISRIRRREPKDKKTDWFFNNEQYDRKMDERADKNQYRNY